MSHYCSIMIFEPEMSEDEIVSDCCDWQSEHCDHRECGRAGPNWPVHFTSQIFETYEEASRYLNKTFGDYDQTAVRYKEQDGSLWWAVACEVHC